MAVTSCSETDPTKFNEDPLGVLGSRISGVSVTHVTLVPQVSPEHHLQSETSADLYKASAAP